MSGIISIKIYAIFFFVCALGSLYNCTGYDDDYNTYVTKLWKTIEQKKLDCSNYSDYCKKNNAKVADSKNLKCENVEESSFEFCKDILRAILNCENKKPREDPKSILGKIFRKVKKFCKVKKIKL